MTKAQILSTLKADRDERLDWVLDKKARGEIDEAAIAKILGFAQGLHYAITLLEGKK